MFINNTFKKRLKYRWTAIFCAVLLAVAGILQGTAADVSENVTAEIAGAEAVHVYAVSERMSSLYEWAMHIYSSAPLYASSDGRPTALLLSLRLPDGWVAEVTADVGAEGMTLTAAQNGTDLRILLDGYPPQGDAEDGKRLLRVVISADPYQEPSVEAIEPAVRLYAEESEGGGLYYMGADGGICRVPLVVKNDLEEREESEEFTTGNSDDTERETEVCTAPRDDISPKPESGGEGKDFSSIYMGCQETAVRDGTYAVRFLFRDGDSTPVVCARGGGVLTMEASSAPWIEAYPENSATPVRYDGDWQVCVFRGLKREGNYEFFVYTAEGIVKVRYRSGKLQ